MATKSAESKQFWRKEIKKRAVEAFGNKCFICGMSFPTSVYDFHHIDRTKKEFSFSSSKVSSKNSWYDVRKELLKCVMVCSNCHRIIHNEENNILIEDKIYFDMKYYNWDKIEYQIDHITGEKICRNTVAKECIKCGVTRDHLSKSGLCKTCASIAQRKVERPTREELKNLIKNKTFVSIGENFNVSDNAIKKWCDFYNLPRTKKQINSYTDEEWLRI